jgi:hypothetical protein
VTSLRSLRAPAVGLGGAVVGLLCVWLTRSEAPGSQTLSNGMQVMHPVYVAPTPWEAYVVAAILGAVVALLAAIVAAQLVRLGRAGARA